MKLNFVKSFQKVEVVQAQNLNKTNLLFLVIVYKIIEVNVIMEGWITIQ